MKPWKPALLLLLFATAAHAAETGTLMRAAELKQKPFIDAAKVADLASQAPLEIVLRQGAWMQVKSGGQQGWVKMLNVRTGGATKAGSAGGGFLSAVNLFKTGSSGTTVTTGVKGLSEEDLRNAQPNMEQLAKLGGYAASADEAGRFAKAGKLANERLDYLPKPSTAQANDENR
ncbi:SH3 domain-containing protein [Chitinimonas arctica]|uniref:SH3 domain-containing protein n=1 Tax=Chitinimonas arctica TaxID=2594795 RepID=A0A516SDU6_9NEIS|nr:SH3 domain-containing protein [Chitinimonas arctica]QDQ26337.1 SH3 domain-containing protein [Chitinimonas arctica]